MLETVPAWLPWAEVAFSIPACLVCLFLLIILITVPLPNACKAFLYINTVALFCLALCQALIAEWTSRNRRGIGPQELYYFPLIFTHQGFYLISTASLFYLTCERLLLCFRPTFYEVHKWSLIPCLLVAGFLESLLVAPLLIMLQYNETRNLSLLFTTHTELITLSLLLICYRQSRHYYATLFSRVSLNIRYQVSEVIELTRVLIPVCTVSLLLKLSIEVLANWVFTDPSYISLSVLVLRIVATTMAYVEPVLLMIRHRSMSRKVVALLNPGSYCFSKVKPALGRQEMPTDEETTRSYFAGLQRDWA